MWNMLRFFCCKMFNGNLEVWLEIVRVMGFFSLRFYYLYVVCSLVEYELIFFFIKDVILNLFLCWEFYILNSLMLFESYFFIYSLCSFYIRNMYVNGYVFFRGIYLEEKVIL